MFTYSEAEWCSKYDVAFTFSLTQTVFLWLNVENWKSEQILDVIFYYTGQQKTLFYQKDFEIFTNNGVELYSKPDVAFRFFRYHTVSP